MESLDQKIAYRLCHEQESFAWGEYSSMKGTREEAARQLLKSGQSTPI